MPRKKPTPPGPAVASLQYPARRKNIPPAGLGAHGVVRETPTVRYAHNPHLPPVLRSSSDPAAADRLPALLAAARERALTADEAALLAAALRRHEPWLEWSGKRERPWCEVEPAPLHLHERVSTEAVLRVLARGDAQRDLFADPQHDYAQAVQFYHYDVDWANRLILGDSLQVMASLARREDLAGKVQTIYVDPPYGIRFASNFQPQLGQRDVKDRQQDLTREPEMVKAYRDTWTLGIHSYLAYLRDRLTLARELLADTGSIFVQISDENLHRVRCVMDEVFGAENFRCIIAFRTTTGKASSGLDVTCDFLLWYSKSDRFRMNPVFAPRGPEDDQNLRSVEWPNGSRQSFGQATGIIDAAKQGAKVWRQNPIASQTPSDSTVFAVKFQDKDFTPNKRGWATNKEGMNRVHHAERLCASGDTLGYVRYLDDFAYKPINNVWDDTRQSGFGEKKTYVVQTAPTVIERCLLMTTDPGDLVLDPTCGSGTTAWVAEQWGRRWIAIDTSRVALALAKHRLLTAKFDYYRLRALSAEDVARNPDGTWIAAPDADGRPTGGRRTFDCRTVPHVTLKSIARNTSLDPIFARHEPILADRLAALNRAAAGVDAALRERLARKLVDKHRREGAAAVTDADVRRWLLPGADPAWMTPAPAARPLKAVTPKQAEKYRGRVPDAAWRAWQAPFDADPDWPRPLQDALAAYRAAWRAKMDEVNGCIAANAEVEELVDQPQVAPGTVRVAGPFSLEGVIAVEEGPDTPIGGAPDGLEAFGGDNGGGAESAVAAAEAHLDTVVRLLRANGVDFPDNRNLKFARLDPVTGPALVHAEGAWADGGGADRRVAVSIGPEAGSVSAPQVEDAVRHASRAGYDDVVFAGFGFDAAAQDAIQNAAHPKLRLHMAQIAPDVAMGDLLRTQPGSQLFRVFSAPRVSGPTRRADGDWEVEVEGMDVYDPVSNALHPTDRARIAAWFLDTDYDGRTFCICQAFFPDRKKWDRLARALGARGARGEGIDPGAFDALSGLCSLPFRRPPGRRAGETWKVAVKVIDPRGAEGLRVLTVDAGRA